MAAAADRKGDDRICRPGGPGTGRWHWPMWLHEQGIRRNRSARDLRSLEDDSIICRQSLNYFRMVCGSVAGTSGGHRK